MNEPKEGLDVKVKPSESTKTKKFQGTHKETYPAKITQVNKGSVDLTVFGNGEIVFLKNIPKSSDTESNRSSWDYDTAE